VAFSSALSLFLLAREICEGKSIIFSHARRFHLGGMMKLRAVFLFLRVAEEKF